MPCHAGVAVPIDSMRICWTSILGNQYGKPMTDLLIEPLLRIMCLPSAAGIACFYTLPTSLRWMVVPALQASSIYIWTHLSGIWSLSVSILVVMAMPFFPQPCEQGRRVKRIHAVANIGTALKFLEGRKVRNKVTTLEEESLSILALTLLSVGP